MTYNKILERVILPAGDLILGTKFMEELDKWREISKFGENQLSELSILNLNRLLEFSTENVPFYKKLRIKKSSDPEQWIKRFPVVSKTDYNSNINDFISCTKSKLIASYSSGSSGVQGIVYMNKHEQSISQAVQTMFWEWSGYYPGKPFVQTGMTPNRGVIKTLKDLFFRTRYYSAFNLDSGSLIKILRKQEGLDNYHLGGYASSIYLLAKTAVDYGIKDVHFDAVISWGDKMFPHYRKMIAKAFNCKVFDTYGTTEGTMIAAQKDLDYYYIISPHVYLELLDDNGNEVQDGEIGNVVVTRLDCYSMPLIRYRNGDLAIKLPKKKYPEKRDLFFPLLEKIIGRDTDIVYTSSGKYMIVHFFTGIFEHVPEIKQFKIIQYDMESIDIEYIPGENFKNKIIEQIENKIFEYLEEEIIINWHKVNYIKPTPSGKPQIIESYIKKQHAALILNKNK